MRGPLSLRNQYALLVLFFVLAEGAASLRTSNFQDLAAMYCGGRILNAGGDPYLTEPLRSCEEGLGIVPHLQANRVVVIIPAPQPAYVLRFFSVGLLPFQVTLAAYLIGLPFAFFLATRALVAVARKPPWMVGLILLPTSMCAIPAGQPTPFVIAAIACAAAAFERGKEARGAVLAAPAFLHPQTGVAVFGTILVLSSRLWTIVLPIVLLFAGLQIQAIGVEHTLRYLTVVLPHQALAEVHNYHEVSVTALAAIFGAPAAAALGAGTVAYVSALLLSPLVAQRLRAAFGSAGAAILVPAAFSCAGTYLHLWESDYAVPLALFLAARATRWQKTFVILLVLLAIPWESLFVAEGPLFAIGMIPALLCIVAIGAMQGLSQRAIALGAIVALVAMIGMGTLLPPTVHGVRWCPAAYPAALASDTWRAVSECFFSSPSLGYRIVRAPTWIGLLGLIIGASALAFSGALGGARREGATAECGANQAVDEPVKV